MALGPKAMGEAIAANLKAKTGKTLEQWLDVLHAEQLTKKPEMIAWLKQRGLGHFQAQLVADRYVGNTLYDNPEQLINDLFAPFPEQYELYKQIIEHAKRKLEFTVNPCKGYIPLYKDGRIFASFKPTKQGLYLGLIGRNFNFDTVEHRASYGGSERMERGVFVDELPLGVQALQESFLVSD